MPLPTLCVLCRCWSRQAVCVHCLRLARPLTARCRRCGLTSPANQDLCGACLLHPPVQHRTLVGVDYGFPWRDLVQRFKFGEAPELARGLADLLLHEVAASVDTVDCLVPIPLTAGRLRERGFNQSWLLAQHLSQALCLPAWPQALLRWRSTEQQAHLDRDQRNANVARAFMPHPEHGQRMRGLRVALIDDVMTTGATMDAAARAVLEAGAHEVSAWVVARTPRPGSLP